MNLTFSLLLLLAICLAITAGLVGRQPLSEHSKPSTNNQPVSASVPSASESGPVRMIRFVLSRDGLYPRQMRVDAGLLNIALEDKTGESDGLVIESALGDQRAKVTQINRAEKHWRGRALIKLTPGRYVVSDASQPSRKADLIVNQ